MAGLIVLPFAVTNQYYLHMINLAGIYTLITLGLNLLTGYTGQVSMGQAGYFAIGTYTAALLMLNTGLSSGWPCLRPCFFALYSAPSLGFRP